MRRLSPSGSRAAETARWTTKHQRRPKIEEIADSDSDVNESGEHEHEWSADEEKGYFADCFLNDDTYAAASLSPHAPTDTKNTSGIQRRNLMVQI